MSAKELNIGDYQMKGSSPLTKDLLQAINKQVEELGWNKIGE